MTDEPQFVDGAMGEGGGQVVRSSMAIAALTGQTVEVRDVRARRNPPGLKPQHVAAVRAAAAICNGELVGDEVGSRQVRLTPSELQGGDYHFDVGTAGSTMLVLQTVLPALLFAKQSSQLTIAGGTHNPMAPSWEFVERAYLPMLQRMGARLKWSLKRRGFYPKGGGQVQVSVQPSTLRPLTVAERGAPQRHEALAICAALPDHIGNREVRTMTSGMGWPIKQSMVVVDANTRSPGNVAILDMQFEHVAEVITELGRINVPAEKVAKRAVRAAKAYLESEAPVGEHLADQLMTPMALLAWKGESTPSRFVTGTLSQHAATLTQLLPQLLDIQIDVDPSPSDDATPEEATPPTTVTISPRTDSPGESC